jgi:uncharacterized protein YbjT (DUF2867 family)
MVATLDIGRTGADLLRETWSGTRIIELEGPRRYCANDIASGLAKALGHHVAVKPVARDSWEALFRAQGAMNPMPRMRMLDGFNEGWIDFERAGTEFRRGHTTLETVLRDLVQKNA